MKVIGMLVATVESAVVNTTLDPIAATSLVGGSHQIAMESEIHHQQGLDRFGGGGTLTLSWNHTPMCRVAHQASLEGKSTCPEPRSHPSSVSP